MLDSPVIIGKVEPLSGSPLRTYLCVLVVLLRGYLARLPYRLAVLPYD